MSVFLIKSKPAPGRQHDLPHARPSVYRIAPALGGCLFVLTLFLVAGCRSNTAGEYLEETGVPMITANPNPVPAGAGKGVTTITWTTGDGSKGEVYMARNGGPEKLFAGLSPRGSQDAAWIQEGEYEFRLYAGKQHKKLLASVKVTRSAN